MDELDTSLIEALSSDARTSVSTLARRLGVARTTVQARIERLERDGVIAGYTIRKGKAAAPMIRAAVLIQVEPRATPMVLQRLKAMPQVELAFTTSGRFDMVLQVAARTPQDLDVILDHIGAVKGVKSSESLIQLSIRIDRR
ncbi:MAG: Lrp/AsnC family transcriptional regulator [Rhodobacteraceae bacterium]|nr:Lrp/AsnC family transcriptional regulator [Paracoccaceae bacterium]MCB1369091.1 Lrp/AsnC family transcriptional regulator [Paracoccaceae bacterium]